VALRYIREYRGEDFERQQVINIVTASWRVQ